MKHAIIALVLVSVAAAQSAPHITFPSQLPPHVLQRDEVVVNGAVIAYDWSTRYYMEGARVERFIFRTEGRSITGASTPRLMRVVLLWHPADNPRIIPGDFYALDKQWQLTLRTTSPFNFVRQYCTTEDTPTFLTDVGNGRKVELPRYVNSAVLPPDTDLVTNFKTAIAKRPRPPEMPDPASLPCLYLQKVAPAEHNE